MNYIEYTKELIDKIKLDDINDVNYRTLVICAGFYDNTNKVKYLNPESDIIDEIENLKYNRNNCILFNSVIMSRVLEHIPIRNIDWYIYNIYTIMKSKGLLYIVTPDMDKVSEKLIDEWEKPNIDLFLINRLNHELFSEGNDVRDRHCFWTNRNSVKYFMEKEGLFKLIDINDIRIDSNIVPNEIEFIFERV